jgi:hypothetical protein
LYGSIDTGVKIVLWMDPSRGIGPGKAAESKSVERKTDAEDA